jgi:hypothetical protein
MDSTGVFLYVPWLFFHTWRPHNPSAAIINNFTYAFQAHGECCHLQQVIRITYPHTHTHTHTRRRLHPARHRFQRCHLSRFVHVAPGQTETVNTHIYWIIIRPWMGNVWTCEIRGFSHRCVTDDSSLRVMPAVWTGLDRRFLGGAQVNDRKLGGDSYLSDWANETALPE